MHVEGIFLFGGLVKDSVVHVCCDRVSRMPQDRGEELDVCDGRWADHPLECFVCEGYLPQ